MNESKQDPKETLLNAIEALININYRILKLLDQRVTRLEDQIEKKGE